MVALLGGTTGSEVTTDAGVKVVAARAVTNRVALLRRLLRRTLDRPTRVLKGCVTAGGTRNKLLDVCMHTILSVRALPMLLTSDPTSRSGGVQATRPDTLNKNLAA